jgi:phi13 family phage major tail protein
VLIRERKDIVMARIGFKKAKYNKISGNSYASLTDSKVPVFEKVIDEKFAPEYNNAELYANDGLAESDYSFKKGTLSLTVADDDDKLCAELLGNTVETSGGEVTSNIENVAPEFGYGHIIPKLVGGVRKYKVEFFPRVKFTKVTSDNKTRGESVEFSTTTIEGTVMPVETAINGLKIGDWEKHNTFATLEEAETYLDGLLTPTT